MTWSEIYKPKISKSGGLKNFILKKEKRSAGMLISRIQQELVPASRILEVGTGTGAIGALLAKYGFDVTVVDNDPEMIEIARNSLELFGKSEQAFLIDINNIVEKFGKNSFECVISHGVLEHYSDIDIRILLNKQLDVAPIVIFVVPMNAMSKKYRAKGFGDERYLTTKFWEDLISKHFYIKNIFGFGFLETYLPTIIEKLLKIDWFSKKLAPFCAFNEFWIIR